MNSHPQNEIFSDFVSLPGQLFEICKSGMYKPERKTLRLSKHAKTSLSIFVCICTAFQLNTRNELRSLNQALAALPILRDEEVRRFVIVYKPNTTKPSAGIHFKMYEPRRETTDDQMNLLVEAFLHIDPSFRLVVCTISKPVDTPHILTEMETYYPCLYEGKAKKSPQN